MAKRVQNKNEVIKELITLFNDPSNQLSEREVAAKYKLDMAIVRSAKRRSKHYKVQDEVLESPVKVVTVEGNHSKNGVSSVVEDKIEKKEDDKVIEEPKKEFPKKLDDEIIIQVMCDLDEGSLSKIKIAEKNDISVSSVYRIEKQYCSKGNDAKKKAVKKHTVTKNTTPPYYQERRKTG